MFKERDVAAFELRFKPHGLRNQRINRGRSNHNLCMRTSNLETRPFIVTHHRKEFSGKLGACEMIDRHSESSSFFSQVSFFATGIRLFKHLENQLSLPQQFSILVSK